MVEMSNKPTAEYSSMDNALSEKQTKVVTVVSGILNLMTAFAAPHYLAQMDRSKAPTRVEFIALFDEFLALFDTPEHQEKDSRIILPARSVRKLLDGWSMTDAAPETLKKAAREFLHEMGVAEPDEGWEQWQPSPTEKV